MRLRYGTAFIALVCALVSCRSAPERRPALGEAYVGPMELPLREALAARAAAVDTLRHGERVEIIGRRRSFYQIRTARGREGWVDARQLLSGQEREALKRLAQRAAEAPPQGAATVLDVLNVHTAPHRLAPSFRQIRPEERAEVIAYERVPRGPYTPQPLLAPATNGRSGTTTQGRVKKQKIRAEPLAPVPAPQLPDNWLELSRTARPAGDGRRAAAAAAAPADLWALVRCADGAAGWVLARMLYLAIPEEVAQYAERARIAAYFQIGSVPARSGARPVWLWAAQSQRDAAHDFDSLRIFVWSARRGRWETSFIERGLKGRLPLELHRAAGGVEGFGVVVQEKDGRYFKRSYRLQAGTFRARLASNEAAEAPAPWVEKIGAAAPEAAPPPESRDWLARLGGWVSGLRSRFSR